MAGAGAVAASCIFCDIARKSTSTTLLHADDKVVAFQDINPSAFRHYLVIPVEHIPTVKDLHRKVEDYSVVSHMLDVGKMLLLRDAPQAKHHRFLPEMRFFCAIETGYSVVKKRKSRFGFHQPPLNSVNHLHLHCLALPYTPRWRCMKYLSLGSLGFIEADKLLEKIKPAVAVP